MVRRFNSRRSKNRQLVVSKNSDKAQKTTNEQPSKFAQAFEKAGGYAALGGGAVLLIGGAAYLVKKLVNWAGDKIDKNRARDKAETQKLLNQSGMQNLNQTLVDDYYASPNLA